MLRLVIFDRDGTLIKDSGYLIEFKDISWTTGALKLLSFLSDHGIHVAVATNQSGIARGYFTFDRVHELHTMMSDKVRAEGGRIDAYAICPHLSGGDVAEYAVDCDCRKPKPLLIKQLLEKFQVSPESAVMFGDRESDVLAGQAAGVKSFLYEGGDLFDFVTRAVHLESQGGNGTKVKMPVFDLWSGDK